MQYRYRRCLKILFNQLDDILALPHQHRYHHRCSSRRSNYMIINNNIATVTSSTATTTTMIVIKISIRMINFNISLLQQQSHHHTLCKANSSCLHRLLKFCNFDHKTVVNFIGYNQSLNSHWCPRSANCISNIATFCCIKVFDRFFIHLKRYHFNCLSISNKRFNFFPNNSPVLYYNLGKEEASDNNNVTFRLYGTNISVKQTLPNTSDNTATIIIGHKSPDSSNSNINKSSNIVDNKNDKSSSSSSMLPKLTTTSRPL
ncbi:unnamed protein product, partial [Onchocerca flexuosa]|uniref:C2H2-type domain-containing protein n=1 Tax=Onchocerca flexuosa TaxID=387005 RepID=A0A183HRC7_9BILA